MGDRVPERILELRKVPMLQPLPTPALLEIVGAFSIETVPAGAALLRRGEPVADVFWVLDGRAQYEGGKITQIGSAIGLVPALARTDAPRSAHALERLRVARIPTERLFELIEDSFDLVHALLAALGRSLHDGGRCALGKGPMGGALPRDIDFTERLVRLRMIPPFSRAPVRALARIAQNSEPVRWTRGACLWERGSEAKSAIAILSGEVQDGDVTLGAGHTAGLVTAFAGVTRSTAAYASAPLDALEIDIETLMDVIEDEDDLAFELLRVCARELLALARESDLPPDLLARAA
jgi:CRP-like cAMP-binding protein